MAYGDFVQMPERRAELRNLGLADRVLRGLLGMALITQVLLVEGPPSAWQLYGVLAGLYPALTALLGWDPVYELAGLRSCGGRQPCAGFPAQVAALLRTGGAEVLRLGRRPQEAGAARRPAEAGQRKAA
ncbi:MAG: DUF2892 domain-containing protein [Gammaproteobacteria bacterium]|nr:MAG: DUF2892 domain-containing protein [Gammaproteobacteria bacterium]